MATQTRVMPLRIPMLGTATQTVEEFLANGGEINEVPTGAAVGTIPHTSRKKRAQIAVQNKHLARSFSEKASALSAIKALPEDLQKEIMSDAPFDTVLRKAPKSSNGRIDYNRIRPSEKRIAVAKEELRCLMRFLEAVRQKEFDIKVNRQIHLSAMRYHGQLAKQVDAWKRSNR